MYMNIRVCVCDSTARLSAGQGSGCRGKECSFSLQSVICCLSSNQSEKQQHLRGSEGSVCGEVGGEKEEGERRNESHVRRGGQN